MHWIARPRCSMWNVCAGRCCSLWISCCCVVRSVTRLRNPCWHVVNCAGAQRFLPLSLRLSHPLSPPLEITLPSSPSISFDYTHTKRKKKKEHKSPGILDLLSWRNYKMLYASVNSTSVAVTLCICHERRQKRDEFALTNGLRGGSRFVCVCVYVCVLICAMGVCSSPSSQMSLNASRGICCGGERASRVLTVPLAPSILLKLLL